jgi:hypothetical protein
MHFPENAIYANNSEIIGRDFQPKCPRLDKAVLTRRSQSGQCHSPQICALGLPKQRTCLSELCQVQKKPFLFSVLIQETKRFEGELILDSKFRGAQDSNLVNANEGACFYKPKSSTFCHRMANEIAQDAFFNKCQ